MLVEFFLMFIDLIFGNGHKEGLHIFVMELKSHNC